jgi:hypothetical protein
MSKSEKPLTRSQKRDIWVSFWLHSIGAAVFGTLGIVAVNAGYFASLKIPIQCIIIGIPTFLVWARFVTKIRKYHESTGIPYPSTYFALAIGSGLLVIGPLLMFFLLLIRMLRVPTLEEENNEITNVGIHLSVPHGESSVALPTLLRHASEKQLDMEQAIEQRRKFETLKPSNKTIMTAKPEVVPPAYQIMDDEPFYEEVAKEMASDSIKPGLWTKAFVDSDGDNERAKFVYIRLRVAQLMGAREAELKELHRLEEERILDEDEKRLEAARLETAELERQKQEAENEDASEKAERTAAMLAEQQRYEKSPDSIRQKEAERFMREFGHLKSYPARVSIGRSFVYFFKEYDLIFSSDAILIKSKDSDKYADILFSPKLNDCIRGGHFWAFDVDAIIELSDGRLLRLNLESRTLNALMSWKYGKFRSPTGS